MAITQIHKIYPVEVTTIEDTRVVSDKVRLIAEVVDGKWEYTFIEFEETPTVETLDKIRCFEIDGHLCTTIEGGLFFCHNDKTIKSKRLLKNPLVSLHYADGKSKEAEFNIYLNPVVATTAKTVKVYATVDELPNNVKYSSKMKVYVPKKRRFNEIDYYIERTYCSFPKGEYKYENITPAVLETLRKIKNSPTTAREVIKQAAKCMHKYTFGCEFEVASSRAPMCEITRYGFLTVYDGSIYGDNPIEYVTLPAEGIEGLVNLIEGLQVLKRHDKLNISCSMHTTFGNLPKDKEFIVALYLLWYRIQHEIMDIMPAYLRDPVGIADKRQNYSAEVPTITHDRISLANLSLEALTNTMYTRLVNLYLGVEVDDTFEGQDTYAWGIHSWRCSSRYFGLNLLKYFRVEKQKLIEFRVHPPTLDYRKTIAWLLLCAATINYANENKQEIILSIQNRQKIMLFDVIQSIPETPIRDFISEYTAHLSAVRWAEHMSAISYANNNGGGARQRFNTLRELAEQEIAEDSILIQDSILWVKRKKKAPINMGLSRGDMMALSSDRN